MQTPQRILRSRESETPWEGPRHLHLDKLPRCLWEPVVWAAGRGCPFPALLLPPPYTFSKATLFPLTQRALLNLF